MMHHVRKAEAKAGYRRNLENDEECLIDLSDFVATGEVTRRLRDEASDVLEDGDGIVWQPSDVERTRKTGKKITRATRERLHAERLGELA